jgi:folylpolyglutamate synthase/dihydropteroate synthase
MGGRLDSTNVLNNQVISIINKIARDHQGFLGNTLSEIAGHKAGILRPGVPYIINSMNEANVQSVIDDYARSIGAGPRLLSTSLELQQRLYGSSKWQRATAKLLPFQQENLKLAMVAVMQTLENLGKSTKPLEIAKTLLLNTSHRHQGRQEFIIATPVFKEATQRKNHILVDGAHNPDAAETLNEFVQNNLRFGQSPRAERPAAGWPVTWVLAMTEGKDAHEYLAKILKPGDKVVTTTFGPVDGMPWVKPMDPKQLLKVAKSVEPTITGVHVPVIGALRALCTAKYMSNQMAPWAPIALTGSLYLVGDLHRELRSRSSKTWWTDTSEAAQADREAFLNIQAEERERVGAALDPKSSSATTPGVRADSAAEEQRKLQEELDALSREAQRLEIEENRLLKDRSTTLCLIDDEQALSAVERLELEDRQFAELYSTPEQITASLARAEKAKEALARQQVMLEAAAKAREEKKEKRLAQKKLQEERRERKTAQRKLAKEESAQRIPPRIKTRNEAHGLGRLREAVRKDESFRKYPLQAGEAFEFVHGDAVTSKTKGHKVLSYPEASVRATRSRSSELAGLSDIIPPQRSESQDALPRSTNHTQRHLSPSAVAARRGAK